MTKKFKGLVLIGITLIAMMLGVFMKEAEVFNHDEEIKNTTETTETVSKSDEHDIAYTYADNIIKILNRMFDEDDVIKTEIIDVPGHQYYRVSVYYHNKYMTTYDMTGVTDLEIATEVAEYIETEVNK